MYVVIGVNSTFLVFLCSTSQQLKSTILKGIFRKEHSCSPTHLSLS